LSHRFHKTGPRSCLTCGLSMILINTVHNLHQTRTMMIPAWGSGGQVCRTAINPCFYYVGITQTEPLSLFILSIMFLSRGLSCCCWFCRRDRDAFLVTRRCSQFVDREPTSQNLQPSEPRRHKTNSVRWRVSYSSRQATIEQSQQQWHAIPYLLFFGSPS